MQVLNRNSFPDDAYAFARLNVEKVEEKREVVTTGSGDNRSTETRITYYLINGDCSS